MPRASASVGRIILADVRRTADADDYLSATIACAEGYDSALRKHYGMDMSELQQRWQQRIGQGNHVAARP